MLETSAGGSIRIEVDAGDTDVGVGGVATFSGASLSSPGGATVRGNGDADTFHFSPSDETPITVEGGDPQTIPGDSVNLDVNGLPSGLLTITERFSSTLSWTGLTNVTSASIESVNIENGQVNVLLDLALAKVDGQPFWDGGSSPDAVEMGLNPALTDLVFQVGRNGAALTDYFSIGKGGVAATSLLGSSDDESVTVRNTVGPTGIRTQGGNDLKGSRVRHRLCGDGRHVPGGELPGGARGGHGELLRSHGQHAAGQQWGRGMTGSRCD